MHKLKIAYFGTPAFSAQLLEKIINDKDLPIEIVLVVTQPDKPVGRELTVTSSPVKEIAKKYFLPVWDKDVNGDIDIFSTWGINGAPTGDKNGNIGMKRVLECVDLALVFAYGFKQLIPLDLLKAPKMGFVNVHPSLLPKFRGSSPIAFPLMMGDTKTGVSLFVMDEKMDHGPLVAQESLEIALNDVRVDIEKKLTDLGFEMIKKLLHSLTHEPVNSFILKDQNHTLATHAHYMMKDHGYIPFSSLQKALKNEPLTFEEIPQIVRNYLVRHPDVSRDLGYNINSKDDVPGLDSRLRGNDKMNDSARIIYNFWRGISPWPGMWTEVSVNGQERRLKIVKLELDNFKTLKLISVQLEGKKEVDFPTFQKAYGLI